MGPPWPPLDFVAPLILPHELGSGFGEERATALPAAARPNLNT